MSTETWKQKIQMCKDAQMHMFDQFKFVAFIPIYILKYKKHLFRIPTCLGQPGLTGKRLDFPRKIVLLFLFGFEADVLEIALQQQHDLVDKIFLVESTQSHRGVG